MKFLSLFAGIGGFDLGLERAGMQCVGQVEIDKKCQAVLAKHWPTITRMGDIRDVKGNEFGAVELICGGVPCQPASQAGKRGGTEDDRWLWPEAFRLVQSINPTWCLFENVYGIITLEGGVVFDNLLSELESFGYEVQTFIIPACGVNALHRRNRVWILAHSIDCSNRPDRRKKKKKGGIPEVDRQKGCSGMSDGTSSNKKVLAHPGLQRQAKYEKQTTGIAKPGPDVPNTAKSGLERKVSKSKFSREQSGLPTECGKWQIEPNVGRVANGVPRRVDRLKQLGNAVVPQVVEVIGRAIMQIEDAREKGEGTGSTSSNTQKLSF